ncbi:MAG: hypothetical protein ACYTEX_10950 [Planctomycetota bacterium]|jgi:hypothetical protein
MKLYVLEARRKKNGKWKPDAPEGELSFVTHRKGDLPHMRQIVRDHTRDYPKEEFRIAEYSPCNPTGPGK